MQERTSLTRFAWLSIAAALVTIGLKGGAYVVTGSVGLLSDALESVVNLAAAVLALWILTVAARPPDEEHMYGHTKAEYFSSGIEGTLIIVAAASIIVAAVPRLINPQPIEQVGIGTVLAVLAALVNLLVARVLLQAGRRARSIALEADARHLLTDVWTTAGVLVGIGVVTLTGWQRLDPLIALLVAANIIWSGVQLLRRSILGLMDTAIPPEQRQALHHILDKYASDEVQFHALRTRQSGGRSFVSFHVLVPNRWTVEHGHGLLERIERDIRAALHPVTVFTHLEPKDDPSSWQDTQLERSEEAAQKTTG